MMPGPDRIADTAPDDPWAKVQKARDELEFALMAADNWRGFGACVDRAATLLAEALAEHAPAEAVAVKPAWPSRREWVCRGILRLCTPESPHPDNVPASQRCGWVDHG